MQAYQGLAITLVCRRILALIKNVQPQRWLITNPAAVGSFRCVYMGQSQKLNIQPRSRSPLVQLAGIRKSFDGKTVIDNLNLTINNGEFLTLLGPSGCGKTTVLRLIAGLENVDSGRIHLEDHDITHVPAENRHVNTVFQSYALFPHMTVFENVAFGLRMQKTPAAEITPRVLDALKMVQLEDFAQRNQSWTEMLGLNAFALFKNKRMAIFFIFSMMLGAELQITNMFGNTFLHSFDKDPLFAGSFIVEHASVLMSISQISETLFILTIPFFLSRYGIKNVMLISIVAWMLRFGLFAFGDPTPFGTVLLVLSMIVYGCAFDFFNISGSVFVEKEVRPEIRASAQGMFLMMTNGFGCILGGMVSGKVVEHFTVEGITDWQSVWLIFAGYSLVLAFAFVALFKYKHVRQPTAAQQSV